MLDIGMEVPSSGVARTLAEAQAIRDQVGLPCVLRPSFTLGGTGGGIAYNREEFNELIARGLDLSPVGEVLIEESVIGWKEFELEVMRDQADNVVIVCSIENLDPMGVHTGDSITVAPAQTLDRQGISADARRRPRDHPRDRRRDRRQQHPVRHQSRQRPNGRHRDEPARSAARRPWPPRPPAFPSPRSPPSWPSAIGSTSCATTSPARRRPASSRPSITSSPRFRAGPSRNSPTPIRR